MTTRSGGLLHHYAALNPGLHGHVFGYGGACGYRLA
jgi:hypothetical protein